ANPAGPGLKINGIEPGFAGRYPSRFQSVHAGSCGVVTMPAPIGLPDPCTIVVRVQPWLLDGRPQTVLSIEPGLTLAVAAEGAVLSEAPIDPSQTECLAWWDFGAEIPTDRIIDRGPHSLHGQLRHLPTRAVRGSYWTGDETSWRHMPRHYAAIHFHEDDLYDCEWETDFAIEIPEGMPSGVYGVRLRCGELQDIVPFYVLPPRGRTTAPIAFLASTFTYQIYGNHQRGNLDDAFRDRQGDWGAYPWNADDHPEYAGSTYNKHSDGSGICYSSLRRPLLTMRPGYITYVDNRGSGLRHFPADTHLTDWLTVKGIPFDVITDHDLDREGV